MLERWQVLVRLMGRHLHTRTATINAMMTVVERAFKLPEQNILAATFRAWQDLMDCFALDPKILRNTKRINLLVRPFTIKNVKTESGYRSKLEAWWHLIHLLGEDAAQFGPTVVVPFLSFCFITKTAGGEGRKEGMGTPQSPAKRHSVLAKLCLEALVQVRFIFRKISNTSPFPGCWLEATGSSSALQLATAHLLRAHFAPAVRVGLRRGNRRSRGSLYSQSWQQDRPTEGRLYLGWYCFLPCLPLLCLYSDHFAQQQCARGHCCLLCRSAGRSGDSPTATASAKYSCIYHHWSLAASSKVYQH